MAEKKDHDVKPQATGDTPPPAPNPPPATPELAPAQRVQVEFLQPAVPIAGRLAVNLERSATEPTTDQALWAAIRNRTEAIGFRNYEAFIKRLLCRQRPEQSEPDFSAQLAELGERHYRGVDTYGLLKAATESFLLLECGVAILPGRNPVTGVRDGEVVGLETSRLGRPLAPGAIDTYLREHLGQRVLPYLKNIVDSLFSEASQGGSSSPFQTEPSPFCTQPLPPRVAQPCLLELIWSYWHEEGMLVQATHALSLRFQNKTRGEGRDPLAQLELDPLRPVSNLLWGYVQDEPFRLTVTRRAYEYEHHYGLSLIGKAVPRLRPADRRSKFLEAFHGLLRQVAIFYKEDADTTVIADGFPLLNGLKECHMILAEGAHNQFGDLPWTARVEMLIQQWLLARSEIKEFLRGRAMVPYKESWMGQVDTMRKIQSWGDTSVTHFRDLGVFGEQILLSIRYGAWVDVVDQDNAKNWARYWKPEIQSYLHAYRATTGVDLTAADPTLPVNATLPSVLLRERLAQPAAR